MCVRACAPLCGTRGGLSVESRGAGGGRAGWGWGHPTLWAVAIHTSQPGPPQAFHLMGGREEAQTPGHVRPVAAGVPGHAWGTALSLVRSRRNQPNRTRWSPGLSTPGPKRGPSYDVTRESTIIWVSWGAHGCPRRASGPPGPSWWCWRPRSLLGPRSGSV